MPPQTTASATAVYASLFDPSKVPTPPAIALRVAQEASRPNCDPAKMTALLSQDPALCAKLLKAVNSCLYGLSKPVVSVEKAVKILGLYAVRSLALGVSLPAMRSGGVTNQAVRSYWLGSVGGAIIARELATVGRHPCPENVLVAGLLRDIGFVLLRDISPADWDAMAARDQPRLVVDPCAAEHEVFGITHEDVSAELLLRWNLPPEIVEPVRHHHHPDRLADQPALAQTALILSLADSLSLLDAVADLPDELTRILALAEERFGLAQESLIEFLQRVAPKIEEFAKLIEQDVGQCPDYAAILTTASSELANMNAEQQTGKIASRSSVIPLSRTNRWQ